MRLGALPLLWLLAIVPVLVIAYSLAAARRRRQLERIGDHPVVARMVADVSPRRRTVRAFLVVLAAGLLAAGLARPQYGARAKLTRKRGIDLVVALDFSKSMLARDVYPSRIERAKRELERLMDELSGDRLGLVAFAGEPLAYPLTTDYAAAKLFFAGLSPQDMPVGGTATARALEKALALLGGPAQAERAVESGRPPRSRVIVLLTDGEDLESDPVAVAREAGRQGVRIYTVGIGSEKGELIPELSEDGAVTGYLRGPGGGFVTSRLDAVGLRKIAEASGGEHFAADPKRLGVDAVIRAVKTLQRAEHEARLVKQYDEVYHWFVWPAFMLLVIESAIGDRKRRRGAAAGAPTSALARVDAPAARRRARA